jgi:Fur family zinc uptake transcriptional regulator
VLGAALLTTLNRLEQRDPFCVACHLHQEKYDRFTRARGRVEDLDQCAIADVLRELSQATGYEVEGHWLELYGRCAECRAKVAVPA